MSCSVDQQSGMSSTQVGLQNAILILFYHRTGWSHHFPVNERYIIGPRFEGGVEWPSVPQVLGAMPLDPPPQCLTFIGINTFD